MGKGKGYIIEMDRDWITLILEAKKMGIGKEDIKNFFKEKHKKKLHTKR
ncbi:anti-repressor SinI family protein [Lederbergia wuyishanensis]|uniref:Sin domain-containing protein n=1 Tax=Lederbergia wuyishanensis TaxID=1347903 RepID=A0ABU0DA33_9BACI|nr:anti-repressor SinI family protein [Lederbergia wuyishanensis]MCJ8008480.1 anti-repressor SinI family protein [Lederbergia wuyishanensis]MDQ0345223.1 hypothetical protein [Lederbergia wuyishanensis]